MRNPIIVIILFSFSLLYSQSSPDFESLMIESERNWGISHETWEIASQMNLPVNIYIPNKAIMYPIAVQDKNIIYAVITNFLHPLKEGYLSTFKEIENSFNLNEAKITYSNDKDNRRVIKTTPPLFLPDSLHLIVDSTNDRVMAFDTFSGDSLYADIIPHSDKLSTPIELLLSPWGNFTISDQVADVVQEFDTSGIFVRTMAPAGGVNTSLVDNMRGIAYHPNGNLLVTVGSGMNDDAIASFNSSGMYLGNFINPNVSQMDGPFDIIIRNNDILISAINTDAIHSYDYDGNFLSDFATGVLFPEQIVELKNGEIAVTNFHSSSSGILIFHAGGGTNTTLLNGVTGNRGVAELGNGNLLTTNASGIYEIDRSTGNVVRTIISGIQARFISFYKYETNTSAFITNLDSLDLTILPEDTLVVDNIVIHNKGNAGLVIDSIVTDNPDLIVTPDSSVLISSGDSVLINIIFYAGVNSGLQSGSIIFYHNAPTSPDSVKITANVLTSLEQTKPTFPEEFQLFQNYPNPFNPRTTIEFSIPTTDFVNLKIYNILGQEVATLVSKKLTPGSYKYNWDASGFPSGIYYYRIAIHLGKIETNSGFVKTRKMIMMK